MSIYINHITPKFLFITSLIWLSFGFISCSKDNEPKPALVLNSIQIADQSLLNSLVAEVGLNTPIILSFSHSIDTNGISEHILLKNDSGESFPLRFNFSNSFRNITIYPKEPFKTYTTYIVSIIDIQSSEVSKTFSASNFSFRTVKGTLVLNTVKSGSILLSSDQKITGVPVNLHLEAVFSDQLDPNSISNENTYLINGSRKIGVETSVSENILTISSQEKLRYWSNYQLVLDTGISAIGATGFTGFKSSFVTGLDSALKYPEITDDELLTLIQQQTFKYFWDFGHPTSGLARERNTSGETVTTGGSGFGLLSIIVGIERGFISRSEGVSRILKMVNFLQTQANRYHGVWPHWMNGSTGATQPFSTYDNGGDLVETGFMWEGLITVRQYMNATDPTESEIISKINQMWNEVEWDWYTKGGENVLYWHWSPNYGWAMNHQISGWNEAMVVYVLAASSESHGIDPVVYKSGWARNGSMRNSGGSSYYGYKLDLRSDRGGPLFFAHYSFLGLDPRKLRDTYADYWNQNVNHSLINWAYCVQNPKNYTGYSSDVWGLTASDNETGYNAHSPDNDLGVITPTAAISSIPYTPEQSMKAIRQFYYILGDRLWGKYGFYDAVNYSKDWTASSFLAIDQGPIICMIENYRTGLLWDLFMSAPEVQTGLTKLGISYE